MTDLVAPDMAIGGLALAAAVLYAAWHEYAAKKPARRKSFGHGGCAWPHRQRDRLASISPNQPTKEIYEMPQLPRNHFGHDRAPRCRN